MAVGLPVGGHMGEPARPPRDALGPAQGVHEGLREPFPPVQEMFEGDGMRDGTIVEEEGEGPALGEGDAVRDRGVDLSASDVGPVASPQRSRAGRLVGREQGEPDPFLGEDVQHLPVHRRLGEPHPLRGPSEALREVPEAPADLRPDVPRGKEGQDAVVVGLGHGGAVPPKAGAALLVGREDALVGLGLALLHPTEERRSHVEADLGEVVHDAQDPLLPVHDPGRRVGLVAFAGDPLVPVVVGAGRRLLLHHVQPGVLPGRLVEMSVDGHEPVQGDPPSGTEDPYKRNRGPRTLPPSSGGVPDPP